VKIQNSKSRPHLAHPGRIAAFISEFIRDTAAVSDREYFKLNH
jgi:hypothetical protein